VQLSAHGSKGREDQLPHLQYNDNITVFDLNIDHLWTNMSDSRFAVEIVVVSGESGPMAMDSTESIDDEYSPGVFQVNIRTKCVWYKEDRT